MPQSFLKMPTAHRLLALSQNPVCLCLCRSNCAADLSLSLAVPASEPGRKLLLSSIHGSHTCICLHLSLICFQHSHLEATGTAEELSVAGFAGDFPGSLPCLDPSMSMLQFLPYLSCLSLALVSSLSYVPMRTDESLLLFLNQVSSWRA